MCPSYMCPTLIVLCVSVLVPATTCTVDVVFHCRYFFLEFKKPEEAVNAVKTGNGYKLDKSHIFTVYFFSDFDKYKNLPKKFEPPKKTEFKEFVSENKFKFIVCFIWYKYVYMH